MPNEICRAKSSTDVSLEPRKQSGIYSVWSSDEHTVPGEVVHMPRAATDMPCNFQNLNSLIQVSFPSFSLSCIL